MAFTGVNNFNCPKKDLRRPEKAGGVHLELVTAEAAGDVLLGTTEQAGCGAEKDRFLGGAAVLQLLILVPDAGRLAVRHENGDVVLRVLGLVRVGLEAVSGQTGVKRAAGDVRRVNGHVDVGPIDVDVDGHVRHVGATAGEHERTNKGAEGKESANQQILLFLI